MDFVVDKKTVFKISLYGKTFELKKPNVRLADKLRRELKDLDDEKQLEIFASFFELLGLPKEETYELELEHFVKLSELVMGSGKKN